jgi:hypothetical protein
MRGVTWKKGSRFDREGSFALEARKEELFPLLCPVLEEKWLPHWACTMVYSESGVAELDAVFTTRDHGLRATWCLITFEPDDLVEYLIVSGSKLVVRLSIALAETGGRPASTRLTWKMRFTAGSHPVAALAGHQFSEASFAAMLEDRRLQLSHYLATGSLLEE